MNDYKNFCEYSFIPENNSKQKIVKIALCCLYTVFAFVYLFIFGVILKSLALIILLPFLVFALVKVTWKYVNKEYEILVEAGEMTVAVIYGASKRRTKKRIYIPDMTLIEKYNERHDAMINSGKISDVESYIISPESSWLWICVYPDVKRGKKHAVIIDTNEELIRILRLCNPVAFVKS